MPEIPPVHRSVPARLVGTMALAATTLVLGWWGLKLTPLPNRERAERVSTTVVDRHDQLLRAYTATDGRWRFSARASDVDPVYIKLLLAYEDRRFYGHLGADPIALMRALGQAAWHRRAVSGGSTLTMQVARLLDGRHDQSVRGKLRQIARAVRLERTLSKDDILALYLTLAPFGGNIEGVRAAALTFLGKEPHRLSLAEAALLVALPQAPEGRRLDRHSARAKKARDGVILRARAQGIITQREAEQAWREPLPTQRYPMPQLSPHLADDARQQTPDARVIRTTLDASLQARLETAVRDHARNLGPDVSAAAIVIDHRNGHTIARVGSAGFLDNQRRGAVDMTRAVRSPGSTLKPFIYGLAFDLGLAHPETLIEDRPARFGTYQPKNFDHDWHGTITIREALAQSLNIPAVKVLDAVGPVRLVSALEGLGINPEFPKDASPTLAIALGGVGLTLEDLTGAYAALARGGSPITIHVRRDDRRPAALLRRPLLSSQAAWQITEILRHAPPPIAAKSGQIAYKTGTSYGHRDAWSVGYDGRHVIAVWVGRADGQSIPGLNGRGHAAPLLFDAFARVATERAPLPARPESVLLAKGDALPVALRRFDKPDDGTPAPQAGYKDPPLKFQFPIDRAELAVDQDQPRLTARVEGGALPLRWLINGAPAPVDGHERQATFATPKAGFLRVTVIDAQGRTDQVRIRLRD